MRCTSTEQHRHAISDTFYCRPRRKVLTLNRCLTDYLETNALEKRGSACFRCMLGRINREQFAYQVENGD
jgi:hypothetical protein